MAKSPAGRGGLRALGLAAVLGATVLVNGCGSGSKSDTAAFCRRYQAAAAIGVTLQSVDNVSLDQFKERVRRAADEAAGAAESAPGDIRKQARRLAEATEKLSDEAAEARDRAALEKAVADYAASARTHRADGETVARWAATHCGVTTVVPATTTLAAPPVTG